ncbi:flagellar hook-associated protein FlgL [Halomonas saccharevitans]|uniref:Flagellar hook-associated protein 3 FlgL n=1 Tax=Halomonas saccharevitans TaxID=416872 RepID=A0A1I6YZW5_9GAMM|nr:flagellar hook-associated protein FlgL [Halomonas saccharevitans]SFT55964.1 flagellar hook-associated protein 3 FlgL [Halomonas saccharevitans]
MRISSVTMFEQSVSSMNRQQSDFLKVSQQIASGRRVVNPSDDPQAASRAVGVDQARAVTQQYADARVSARNSLSQTESVLNSVSDAVTSAKTLLVQASSETLSDVDRQSVASELRGVYETLIGQANATDGNGRHLFGGYQDSTEPFVKKDGRVEYVGDSNNREQRVDASRLMEVSDNGQAIFQSVPSGAGHVATVDTGNTGSMTFKGPQIVDQERVKPTQAYDIDFDDTSGDMRYSVTDSDGNVVADGVYQADGEESMRVEFEGLSMELSGEPADGDAIAVNPADQGNTDLFATLENAIAVLESPAENANDKAALRNTLSTSMRELDNSLDNVLTTRASVGARLNELDVVDSVGGNRMINYEQTLSDLVDLDYSEAIGEYSLRQVGLQASQQAFADMKGMSLFQYL